MASVSFSLSASSNCFFFSNFAVRINSSRTSSFTSSNGLYVLGGSGMILGSSGIGVSKTDRSSTGSAGASLSSVSSFSPFSSVGSVGVSSVASGSEFAGDSSSAFSFSSWNKFKQSSPSSVFSSLLCSAAGSSGSGAPASVFSPSASPDVSPGSELSSASLSTWSNTSAGAIYCSILVS